MKILVTGGAGYIGSVVTETLAAAGYELTVFDNLSAGHRNAVGEDIPLIEGDLAVPAQIQDACRGAGFQAVVHLAGATIVAESVTNPEKFRLNNVTAGCNLLEAMAAGGIPQIIFSSTAAVYGEPRTPLLTEDHPLHPVNPYGESKMIMEQALEEYGRKHGIRYIILRYFNAAGASARYGEDHNPESHLIPNVLRAAADPSVTLEMFGNDYPTPDGTAVRDYVHIKDIAQAHQLALARMTALNGRIFNLGSERGYSVAEVVRTAVEITGHDIKISLRPRRAGDPAVLVASAARARAELGWHPQHTELKTIIRDAWQWRQSHPRGYER